MQELWHLLSSPRHIMVFEAAARHGSFTLAADELNVQQPAVSATIKQLEETLGLALFVREHRQISLTAAGLRLYSDVNRSFEDLLVSARAVRHLSREDYVTLNASSAFSYYWMMPHLTQLHERHPGIDLRLQASDREPDIDSENISLAVRRGDGSWPGCESALIAIEEIYPVASPRVMATAVNLKGLANLLHQRLIHLEEPIRDRPTWRQWFAHFDIKNATVEGGLRLNDYALVLQACMAGEGFAFGWKHLTDPLVRDGVMAAKPEWTWKTGLGFYLVWSKTRPLSSAAKNVRDWILEDR
ncbi:MAG: LysR family transcriptional regulator [Boseongicola sp.]|nr:MAG: LysR family transcriptional regulator [Boseongicola sp.]